MTFADNYSIRSKSITANSIASALDALVSDIQTDEHTTLINTTSVAGVAYTGISITVTVNANEKVLLLANMNCSADASGTKVILDITEDGTVITPITGGYFLTARNNTAGIDGTIAIHGYSAPAAGSHTYQLKWYTSTGTAYSLGARLTVIVLQAG